MALTRELSQFSVNFLGANETPRPKSAINPRSPAILNRPNRAAHSGPIFDMVSYAMICGIAPLTAVTVYNWRYVSSFAIGIAAVAVALSFPTAGRPLQPSRDPGRAVA
jgi:hypothetical protein